MPALIALCVGWDDGKEAERGRACANEERGGLGFHGTRWSPTHGATTLDGAEVGKRVALALGGVDGAAVGAVVSLTVVPFFDTDGAG